MKELVDELKKRRLTISSCESCTGGLFASLMTEIPGVSSVFKGAVVTYATEIKTRVVKVSEKTISLHGVVSVETAKEMAERTNKMMKTDMCVSFTGNAGPDIMEGKPAGFICCAIALGKDTEVFEFQFDGERNEIRNECVQAIKQKCLELIRKKAIVGE